MAAASARARSTSVAAAARVGPFCIGWAAVPLPFRLSEGGKANFPRNEGPCPRDERKEHEQSTERGLRQRKCVAHIHSAPSSAAILSSHLSGFPAFPPPSQLSPDEKCSAAVAVLWLQNEPHRHHCRHRRPHTVTVVQVVDLSFFFPHRRTLSFLVSSRFNIDCGGGGGKRGNDGGRGRWRMVLRCQFHPLPSLIPSRILVVLSSASATVVLFFLLHSLPFLPSPINLSCLPRSILAGRVPLPLF